MEILNRKNQAAFLTLQVAYLVTKSVKIIWLACIIIYVSKSDLTFYNSTIPCLTWLKGLVYLRTLNFYMHLWKKFLTFNRLVRMSGFGLVIRNIDVSSAASLSSVSVSAGAYTKVPSCRLVLFSNLFGTGCITTFLPFHFRFNYKLNFRMLILYRLNWAFIGCFHWEKKKI